ncbi:MAG TPA: hypothetical protein VEV82_04610 [Actinomycetota bacterium]|nr:hypothetical protein [Actinomycetota bacterium]
MNQKNLAIYLNDHLAGSIAGVELGKRAAGSNEGNEYGDFLAKLVIEIEEDQVNLIKLMEHLGVRKDLLKDAAAWMGEKVGRLKLNGKLIGYSDLSRVVEFEGLFLGVQAKLSLWRNLKLLNLPEIASSGIDLSELESRAQNQIAGLEEYRTKAAAEALG